MNNFFVITGDPGSGKTTLLHKLRKRGYRCVKEAVHCFYRHHLLICFNSVN